MQLDDLIALCQEFNDLGWAVAAQLAEVVDGDDLTTKNPNALRMCQKFLREAANHDIEGAEDLAERIKEHLSATVS